MIEHRRGYQKVCRCVEPKPPIYYVKWLAPPERGVCKGCGKIRIILERRIKAMAIPKAGIFEIMDKPTNIDMLVGKMASRRQKTYDLFEALEILDSTKVLKTTVKEFGHKSFRNMYTHLMQLAKKKDKRIGVVEKDGQVLIFNR